MSHSRSPGYQPGNHWVECMRCGFDYRHDQMKKEWNGLIVCKECWEPRHPQDFVRGVNDDTAAKGLVFPTTAEINATQAYQPNAVRFESSLYLRGAPLSNFAAAKVGTVSFWYLFSNAAAELNNQSLFNTSNGRFRIFTNSSGNTVQFNIRGQNSSDTLILLLKSTFVAANQRWHHLVASWDAANGLANVVVDGVDDTEISTLTDDTTDYDDTDFSVGGNTGGGALVQGINFSELWLNNEYVDLTSSANVEKWRSSDGQAVNLGTDGSTPTGNVPALYLNGDSTTFTTNAGNGGDITLSTGNGVLYSNSTPNRPGTITSSTITVPSGTFPIDEVAS